MFPLFLLVLSSPYTILICFFMLTMVCVLSPLTHSTLTIIWFYFAVCLFSREWSGDFFNLGSCLGVFSSSIFYYGLSLRL